MKLNEYDINNPPKVKFLSQVMLEKPKSKQVEEILDLYKVGETLAGKTITTASDYIGEISGFHRFSVYSDVERNGRLTREALFVIESNDLIEFDIYIQIAYFNMSLYDGDVEYQKWGNHKFVFTIHDLDKLFDLMTEITKCYEGRQ